MWLLRIRDFFINDTGYINNSCTQSLNLFQIHELDNDFANSIPLQGDVDVMDSFISILFHI